MTVYKEGTLEQPGEVWLASSGWNKDGEEPTKWLERVYPELFEKWLKAIW
jgi:hypothetical protein